MENIKEKKVNRIFYKVFPWYAGLSSDLLFWASIDTLFLSLVKNLSASQIIALTTFSTILSIIFQYPVLKIAKRIGNTLSVRLGTFVLLLSSIYLTFGNEFKWLVLGKFCHEIAFSFKNMENIMLKNNLEVDNKKDEYVKIRSKGNTIYAVMTMIIAFIASHIFNMNSYYPMIFCMAFCILNFVLCFFIKDYSPYNYVHEEVIKSTYKDKEKVEKIKNDIKKHNNNLILNLKNYNPYKIMMFIIIVYGLTFLLVDLGQANSKLFIQEELLKSFDKDSATIYLGIIIVLSRIGRVLVDFVFDKIHTKFRDKTGYLIVGNLFIAFILLIIGSFMNNLLIQFVLMGIGFVIILSTRDPYSVYFQDLALEYTPKDKHQDVTIYMGLFRKLGVASFGLVITSLLEVKPMIYIISLLLTHHHQD